MQADGFLHKIMKKINVFLFPKVFVFEFRVNTDHANIILLRANDAKRIQSA